MNINFPPPDFIIVFLLVLMSLTSKLFLNDFYMYIKLCFFNPNFIRKEGSGSHKLNGFYLLGNLYFFFITQGRL